MNSVFETPNPILFGRGTSALLGEKATGLGIKKALVVYDKGIKAAGIVDRLLDHLKAASIEIVVFDKVEADPPDFLVHEAGALGVAEKVDGIIGIGGGSSIDTAKGARVLLTNPPPIRQYSEFGGHAPDGSKMKPLIVIPTTAGTGSEGSPGGVITDTEKGVKYPILCSVSLALIDPELTLGLPPGITASTGFDALSHAVEVITSKAPNRFSEIFARESVALIAKYLPIACRNGSNIEAREAMSLAASLGGMALRGPLGGIPHDIGMCIGAKYHAPHGTTVGCLLAETMKFIAPAVPDKLRIVAESMGEPIPADASPEEIGESLCETIRKFYKEVNLPLMSSFIKTKEELIDNVDSLYKGTSFTPRPLTREAVIDILANSFDKN